MTVASKSGEDTSPDFCHARRVVCAFCCMFAALAVAVRDDARVI